MAKTADDYRKDVARLRAQLRAAEKKELEDAGRWLVDQFADPSVDGTTAKIEAAKAKVLGQQSTALMDDADAEEVDHDPEGSVGHGEATETDHGSGVVADEGVSAYRADEARWG